MEVQLKWDDELHSFRWQDGHTWEFLQIKIRRVFGFSGDENFRVTYTDEDGDTVTIMTEEDLTVAVGHPPFVPLVLVVIRASTPQLVLTKAATSSSSKRDLSVMLADLETTLKELLEEVDKSPSGQSQPSATLLSRLDDLKLKLAPASAVPLPETKPEMKQIEYQAHMLFAGGTFADLTAVKPGTHISKTWRMRNTGAHAWPAGVQLEFTHSSTGVSPTNLVLPTLQQTIGPGVIADVTATFDAPMAPGRYYFTFRLRLPGGERFGNRVWTDFVVDPEAEPLAAGTADTKPSHAIAEVKTLVQATTPSTPAVTSVATPDVAKQPLPAPLAAQPSVSVPAPKPLDRQANLPRPESTSSPSPSPASQATILPQSDYDYRAELDKLKAMGFFNKHECLRLLRKHQGNVSAVVQELLNHMDNDWFSKH